MIVVIHVVISLQDNVALDVHIALINRLSPSVIRRKRVEAKLRGELGLGIRVNILEGQDADQVIQYRD